MHLKKSFIDLSSIIKYHLTQHEYVEAEKEILLDLISIIYKEEQNIFCFSSFDSNNKTEEETTLLYEATEFLAKENIHTHELPYHDIIALFQQSPQENSVIFSYDKKLHKAIANGFNFYSLKENKTLNLKNYNLENPFTINQQYLKTLLLGDPDLNTETGLFFEQNALVSLLKENTTVKEVFSNFERYNKSPVLRRIVPMINQELITLDNVWHSTKPLKKQNINFDLKKQTAQPNQEALSFLIKKNIPTNNIEISTIEKIFVTDINKNNICDKLKKIKTCALNLFKENDKLGLSIYSQNRALVFLDFQSSIKDLKPFFENSNVFKISSDSKNFLKLLIQNNVTPKGFNFDPSQCAYTLDSGKYSDPQKQSLSYLLKLFLKKENKSIDNNISLQLNEGLLKSKQLYEMAKAMHSYFKEHHPTTLSYYITYESKINKIIAHMELEGLPLKKTTLAREMNEIKNQMTLINNKVSSLVGSNIVLDKKNIKSLIYNDLRLIQSKRNQSIAFAYLKTYLPKENPLSELFLSHIKLSQALQDITKFYTHIKNDKVFPTFNTTKTKTLRLSAENPPVQGLPKTGRATVVKEAIEASINNKIVAIDYSQFELKILASMTLDPTLINAFENNLDIHTATASSIFEIPYQEVSETQRKAAKAINFGLIYGMTSFGLAKKLECSDQQAQGFIDRYFEKMPYVQFFLTQKENEAKQFGAVTTILGRKISIEGIYDTEPKTQSSALRKAKNAPFQGSAADIMKIAMVKLYNLIETEYPKSRMINQVQDELVFEVPHEQVNNFTNKARFIMENIVETIIPLTVDIEVGNNLKAVKKLPLPEKNTAYENNTTPSFR